MNVCHTVTGALATLLIFTQVQVAPGQAPSPRQCRECRAMQDFGSCATPAEGRTLFRATVVGVERGGCTVILSLDVERATELGLSPRIQVDLGDCTFWTGAVGDVIDVAIGARLDGGDVYSLACRVSRY